MICNLELSERRKIIRRFKDDLTWPSNLPEIFETRPNLVNFRLQNPSFSVLFRFQNYGTLPHRCFGLDWALYKLQNCTVGFLTRAGTLLTQQKIAILRVNFLY